MLDVSVNGLARSGSVGNLLAFLLFSEVIFGMFEYFLNELLSVQVLRYQLTVRYG